MTLITTMARSTVVACILGLFAPGCSKPSTDAQGRCERSGDVAKQLVADGATLLDVRTQAEWTAGHLQGATHIPVDELSSRMGELNRDSTVVAYCRSGRRAESSAKELRASGYDVYVLGGMSDWDRAGNCK
jgi:rhodanese-related sulfurtransferase